MIGRTAIVIAACIGMLIGFDGAAAVGGALQEEQARNAEAAYKEADAARDKTESFEERLAIMKDFLDEFPESRYTTRALGSIVYYQGEKLGNYRLAIRYVEWIRGKINDPDIALELEKRMIVFYGEAGQASKMCDLADRLDSEGKLRFGNYWDVIEGAVDNDAWKLAIEYCRRASLLANADTFRADYPDSEFSDEEAERAGRNRVGMLITKKSWAIANLGNIDDALEGYGRADRLVRHDYFDIPQYGLEEYWARTLLMKKDYRGAIERFAVDALVKRDETALAGLKAAYAGLNGGMDGFEAFAADLHRRKAKTIDGFELPDYDGERHTFARLKGEVTLVVFWSPT